MQKSEKKDKTARFTFRGEELMLLPEKAIFWKKYKVLFLADLHLGKVSHFRKAGIAVPNQAKRATIDRLEDLMLRYLPDQVIILGDLFHSEYNQGWLLFNDLIERYKEIQFVLVQGNHDILEMDFYENSRMELITGWLEKGPFVFSHEPLDTVYKDLYNLCGHLHPGVRMVGRGLQSLKLPCFYFGDHTGILPAFGVFTGTAIIRPQEGESVYVVAKERVVQVQ